MIATTRLGIVEQQVVEPVLGEEELARLRAVARPALGQHADVAAGAEAALAGVVDQDQLDAGSSRQASSASVISRHMWWSARAAPAGG